MGHAKEVMLSSAGAMCGAGMEPILLGKFLENCKMEKQRTRAPYPVIVRTFIGQGVPGVMAGVLPWGVLLASSKGLFFGIGKAAADSTLDKFGLFQDGGLVRGMIVGSAAGATQGVGIAPFLLASTRINQAIAEQGAKAAGLGFSFRILGDVVKKEGIIALTTGIGTNAGKRGLDWAVRFLVLELLREPIRENIREEAKAKGVEPNLQLSTGTKLWTSLAAGFFSVYVSTPIDRLLPLLQQKGGNKSPSFLIKEGFKGGLPVMYSGAVARSLHSAWHVMLLLTAGDYIAKLFGAKGGH